MKLGIYENSFEAWEGFVERIPSWSHIFFQQYHVFISCQNNTQPKEKIIAGKYCQKLPKHKILYFFVSVKKNRTKYILPHICFIRVGEITDLNIQITKHIKGSVVGQPVGWCVTCYLFILRVSKASVVSSSYFVEGFSKLVSYKIKSFSSQATEVWAE